MTRVLVTGATGFVGSALIKRLASLDGFDAVAAVRHAGLTLPPGVEQVHLQELSELSPKLADVDAIVHCAARVHVMSDGSVDPLAEFRRINTDATLQLAEAAAQAGVRRFLFLSSIKASGEETFAEPFTELTPSRSETPYGQTKLDAEIGLRRIANQTGLEVVIVRPPLVYAAHAGGNFARLLRWLHRGLPLPLALVNNRRSYIALDNLVDVCIRGVVHPKAANELFLVSDGEDLSTPELLRMIADGMDKPARMLPLPVPLIGLAARLLGRGDAVRQVCGSLVIDSSKVRQMLDWQPPLGTKAALKAAGAAFAATMR